MSRPAEWEDDQRMDVLFSNFRQSRDVNPRDWDGKLKFWTQMVMSECSKGPELYFSLQTLPQRFRRKDKVPRCLEKVVHEMRRSGKLQSLSELMSSSDISWLSWGFSVMVKNPLKWSWSLVAGQPQIDPKEEYVIIDVVKEKAALVLERHYKNCKNEMTGNIMELKELERTCADICGDSRSLLVVLAQLSKDKKVHITETHNKEKLIKFVQKDESKVVPLSEVEKKILRVRQTVEKLESEIQQFSNEMERCRNDARFYINKGMSNSAKNALRRKKKLELQQQKRESALMNIQALLSNIEDAESDKMIAEAYESGVSAFKQQIKRAGLSPDRLDETMTDMQEVFDLNTELNDAVSFNVTDSVLDVSTSDLEAELESLLAEDQAAPSSGKETLESSDDTVRINDVRRDVGNLSIRESDLPSPPRFAPGDFDGNHGRQAPVMIPAPEGFS